jgi:hypothetical protein
MQIFENRVFFQLSSCGGSRHNQSRSSTFQTESPIANVGRFPAFVCSGEFGLQFFLKSGGTMFPMYDQVRVSFFHAVTRYFYHPIETTTNIATIEPTSINQAQINSPEITIKNV